MNFDIQSIVPLITLIVVIAHAILNRYTLNAIKNNDLKHLEIDVKSILKIQCRHGKTINRIDKKVAVHDKQIDILEKSRKK